MLSWNLTAGCVMDMCLLCYLWCMLMESLSLQALCPQRTVLSVPGDGLFGSSPCARLDKVPSRPDSMCFPEIFFKKTNFLNSGLLLVS